MKPGERLKCGRQRIVFGISNQQDGIARVQSIEQLEAALRCPYGFG